MAKTLTLVPEKPKAWLMLLAWVFILIFAGKFVIHDALPYLGFEEEVFGRYWRMKWLGSMNSEIS